MIGTGYPGQGVAFAVVAVRSMRRAEAGSFEKWRAMRDFGACAMTGCSVQLDGTSGIGRCQSCRARCKHGTFLAKDPLPSPNPSPVWNWKHVDLQTLQCQACTHLDMASRGLAEELRMVLPQAREFRTEGGCFRA